MKSWRVPISGQNRSKTPVAHWFEDGSDQDMVQTSCAKMVNPHYALVIDGQRHCTYCMARIEKESGK